MITEATTIAQKAVEKPYESAILAPMASKARKEILPIAVLAMINSEYFLNDLGA